MTCVVSERFDNLGATGAPVRLGIMGGTFDPIHVGHLAIAEAARVQLNLNAVLFVPTGMPVFKRDVYVTPAEHRLACVRLAVRDNQYFDASSIEIDRAGDTYTVDTLRALREHYPENVSFYFITGSDAALTLTKWRSSAEIAELAHLVVVERPGSPVTESDLAAIRTAGNFDIAVVRDVMLDVSSSDLRARAARGESLRYLVSEEVYAYIEEHALYAVPAAQEAEENVFCEAFYEACKTELQTRVKTKRYHHILGVADTARLLARTYGANEEHAYLAGLLHDWDKGYDDDGIRARVAELGLTVDSFVLDNMPQVVHGPSAACALSREHPSIPDDVLCAIRRHTAGAIDMSDLDMIVYVADAIEPARDYPGVDVLRGLIGTSSLEQLFYETFKRTFLNLVERGRTVHPDTVDVWNYYCLRERAREGKPAGKRKGSKWEK